MIARWTYLPTNYSDMKFRLTFYAHSQILQPKYIDSGLFHYVMQTSMKEIDKERLYRTSQQQYVIKFQLFRVSYMDLISLFSSI